MDNCSVANKTFNSLDVVCSPGYDGGLKQSFVIEVYPQRAYEEFKRVDRAFAIELDGGQGLDSTIPAGATRTEGSGGAEDSFDPLLSSMAPISRMEVQHQPRFEVDNLPHGTGFTLVVYARNSKVHWLRDLHIVTT